MSNHDTRPPVAQATPVRMTLWALLFALLMLLFVTFSVVTMVLPRPRTLEQADGERRLKLIGDRTQKQKAVLENYGWVDEKKQQAHIPIEKAMQQYLESVQAPK